ncbi:RNA 2',3'-cyclic phosphodiesterase [Rummeliibacillus pycnus]|uniref:RNA 2',3'-cyclic phosphodiesterase n=1 Tax=Rummeliibacillus pycnus TaxID=101070 RepID=UPI000C9B28D3|nr:RNA 2',3'-cyclic phosphodiesterase [Rummeliibacillus pycnus]
MEHNTHYFWAVQLPENIKQSIHEEMMNLKSIFQFKRWVHMSDYHITLSFLGSMDAQRQDSVIDLVGNAIKDEKAFKLQIQGINIFGDQKSPRIFWGAVNHERALFHLQTIVQEKCQEAGFTLETRPYHPHITIARKWSGDEEFNMEFLERYNPFQESLLSFQANKIVLYKTNLEKTPKYEPIETFTLIE